MGSIEVRLLSSLEKVFADEAPSAREFTNGKACLNEVFSFQLAYRCGELYPEGVSLRAESGLAECITLREVALVPSELPVHPDNDDDVLRRMPGLFPDLLRPLAQALPMLPGQWRSVWVTVEPKGSMPAGRYPITLHLESTRLGEVGGAEFTLELINALLPEQKLINTQWFHTDGIIRYYGLPVFSEGYWRMVEKYMAMAVSRGINLILTPILTPPLDTQEGGERATVQLTEIIRDGDRYTFRFDRLRRWIELCRRTGIPNLEINHMFTQWGARHAPKVMATDFADGQEKRIFGWETDAAGPEYRNFLEQLIPALLAVLREQGMDKNTYFHVSDEPGALHMEQYRLVGDHFKRLVAGYPVMDALSDYNFYKTGAVEHPIPAVDHIKPFLDGGVPGLWTYYCVGQFRKVSNRFFGMPSARNRVIGLQLYKFRIEGFLQWGYNFYNTRLSKAPVNPFCVTDAGRAFPSGDAFTVYPGDDGPWSSLRFEVFYEALQDQRALELAESLTDRETVLNILEDGLAEPLTFDEYPHDAQWLLSVREKINNLIQSKL